MSACRKLHSVGIGWTEHRVMQQGNKRNRVNKFCEMFVTTIVKLSD